MQAFADDHLDQEVWLNSFYKEKDSIESMHTYRKTTLGDYRALREEGSPEQFPLCAFWLSSRMRTFSQCVPSYAYIVVLGNHENRIWTKSEKFALVLWPDLLRYIASLAVQKRRLLKQGDCKNMFCDGDLLENGVAIVRPPNGDPSAAKHKFWLLKKTLYGLCQSPRH